MHTPLHSAITVLGELCGAHQGGNGEDIPGADREPPDTAGASTQSGALVFHVVSIRRKSQVSAGILHLLAVPLETTPWSLPRAKGTHPMLHRACSGQMPHCEVGRVRHGEEVIEEVISISW